MNIVKAIMPKEQAFFDLFERHASALVAAADALVRLLEGGAVARTCREIHDLEHSADEITHEVLLAVRRSFITPFDRGAITGLISSMDDAIDEMWQTAKAITRYEISAFEPPLREMSKLAAEAARLIAEAVPLLRNVGRNGAALHSITEAVVRLESRADELYEKGLTALYRAHRADQPMAFIVEREIYDHVERVLDRLEDVADEIQGIVIDHA
ncbi:MAG: DUF47 domain-containing protein [Allosphingosinicella sp.]